MFERHVSLEKPLVIPLSGNRFKIDYLGNVTDEEGNVVKTTLNEQNQPEVYIKCWNGWKSYRVAMLIALTFKPIQVSFKLWGKLNVVFLDGDENNTHPENLVWKFPIGLEPPYRHGYAYIPSFTRYAVNKNGDLINVASGQTIRQFSYKSGYVQYSTIRPDVGYKTTLHRHRAVCLAWTDYPVNVDEMTVNHINGVPGSDDLSNLEWLSVADNFNHAIATGLSKGTNIETVFVRNAKTGEINEFNSVEECGENYGLSYDMVHYRCRKKNQAIWPGYLQFQFKHLFEPWRIPEDLEKEHREAYYGNFVLVRDVRTNEVYEYQSAKECSEAFGYSELTIAVRLRTPGQKVYHDGLQFKRKHDATPWRIVDDVEAEIKAAQLSQEVWVRDIFTNEEWKFNSVSETCKGLTVPQHVVMDRKDNRFNYPWFNLEFKFNDEPWRVHSETDFEIFKDAIKRNKAFKGRGYILTDIHSGEKKYYAFIADVLKDLDLGSRSNALTTATKRGILRNKWRIEPNFENY